MQEPKLHIHIIMEDKFCTNLGDYCYTYCNNEQKQRFDDDGTVVLLGCSPFFSGVPQHQCHPSDEDA